MLGVVGLLAAGCGTAEGKSAAWHASPAGGTSASPSPSASPAATITAPANGATDVPTSVELTLAGGNANASITLTDAAGTQVTGAARADGSTWVPATQLQYSTAYTATTAGGAKITFTTMAKPKKLVSTNVTMSNGATYGVAMPVVVHFGSSVAADQRANVEKRLMVASDPPQIGTWFWYGGQDLHYRPKEYWQPGTKIAVRLATGGLALGNNGFGQKDVTVNVTIGDKFLMVTDDATHTMTVTRNDQVVKSIPVSMGKPSTPSSSGQMVIITKNTTEKFVSTDPKDPYELNVNFAQRLTWSGQYIHAAPWSVGSQGKRNVSHGCTNVSDGNAKWLYDNTHIGDPVVVRGTPRKLDWGNGWTDWDRPWDQYVKGSALPAPVG
jgi:lipoprotein-anchoring transpeptidase ErfK/SrfK